MNIKKITAAFLSFAVLAGGITCNEIYLNNEFAVSAVEESNEQLEDSTDFSITQVPDKLVYNIGEELDLTGGMAYAKGVYNGENWDTSNQPLDSEHFKIDASEFDNQESGTYSIYVTNTYGVPVTESFEVEIVEKAVVTTTAPVIADNTIVYTSTTGQSYSTGSVSISKLPDKVVYNIGEELDFTGGTISGDGVVYQDGKVLSRWHIYGEIANYTIDSSDFNNQKPGAYTIRVKTPQGSTSFTVTVVRGDNSTTTTTTTTSDDNYTSIGMNKLPDKLVYNIGEELDLTGGMAYAKGVYNGENWDTSNQPLDSEHFEIDASEFDNQESGTYSIYVTNTYGVPVTESFEVEIVEKAVVTTTAPVIADNTIVYTSTTRDYSSGSIHMSSLPDKVVYNIGEELDFTGGTISGCGSTSCGGNWDIFSAPITGYTIDSSEFNNQKPGMYTIYVSFGKYYTAFTVTVVRDDNSTTTITTTTATTSDIPEVIYGDANCDGVVDIADIAIVKCYLINSEKYSMTSKGLKNADVQGNENGINVNDAIAIQKYVLGIIDSFSE